MPVNVQALHHNIALSTNGRAACLQVAGLWIILSITTMAGLLLAGITVLKRKLKGGSSKGSGGGSGGSRGAQAALPGVQEAVSPTGKPSFWGTTLSFKSRAGGGSATGSEAGTPLGASNPARRTSIISRFAGGGSNRPSWTGEAHDEALPGGILQSPGGPGAWQGVGEKGGQRASAAMHAEADEGR